MLCKGCNGKGTWFSPMKGDIECDWCHGSGEVCDCRPNGSAPGKKCWLCLRYVPPEFECEDTDPAIFMDGDDGFKILTEEQKNTDWRTEKTPPYGAPLYDLSWYGP